MWVIISEWRQEKIASWSFVSRHDFYDDAEANAELLYSKLDDYSDITYHVIEVV